MTSPEYLLALLLATAVLVAVPGPNVALIVANSLAFGVRAGLSSVAGTTTGTLVQLAVVSLGLAALVEFAAEVFTWLRWFGVVYLLWLGIRTFRSRPAGLEGVVAHREMFWRSCCIAAVNPKTLIFNAAFLPQFLPPGGGAAELLVLAAVFLGVLALGDVLWAVFAASARPLFARITGAANRIAGSVLVLAAIGLAAARRPA